MTNTSTKRRKLITMTRDYWRFVLLVVLLLMATLEESLAFVASVKATSSRTTHGPLTSATTADFSIASIITPKTKRIDVDAVLPEHQAKDVDSLRARAAILRRSILRQQVELQQVEREIQCCTNTQGWVGATVNRAIYSFKDSSNVLIRKLNRVKGSVGVQNERWHGSVREFMVAQTTSGVRIVDRLLHNSTQLLQLMDPETPTLITHIPALLARLDRLEPHYPQILERVLNNQRHLRAIEPYLNEILERFDDIEPHLPWILDHIDVLAPYCGLLLKHIDELLPYARLDEDEMLYGGEKDSTNYQYALAEQLLPHLEFYVSRLDTVGPHLPLLRPHIPKLLKHNRIAKISPHIDRLFALGYKDNLGASANMDVLLFWFGWALRVPGLPRLFFAIPGSPRIVTFLANRLPKRFVRGYCHGISCTVDGDYGVQWNSLRKA